MLLTSEKLAPFTNVNSEIDRTERGCTPKLWLVQGAPVHSLLQPGEAPENLPRLAREGQLDGWMDDKILTLTLTLTLFFFFV